MGQRGTDRYYLERDDRRVDEGLLYHRSLAGRRIKTESGAGSKTKSNCYGNGRKYEYFERFGHGKSRKASPLF